MKRFKLQTNSSKKLKLKSKTMTGRQDDYAYLRFYRKQETISRVDRYSIVIYWQDYDSKGNAVTMSDLFFYPSEAGMDEIDEYARQRDNGKAIVTKRADYLMHRLEQLRCYGNMWWRQDVNFELTEDNWLLGTPPMKTTPNTSKSNGSKRLQLKVKNNTLKKYTLISK